MKFRIFDNILEYYVEEPEHRWLLSVDGNLYNSKIDKWYKSGNKEYLIEFSTGFNIKGNEIYENDLLIEELEFDHGDEQIEYIVTWLKERSQFVLLTLEEREFYDNNGFEKLESEHGGDIGFFISETDLNVMVYKGSYFEYLQNKTYDENFEELDEE